MVTFWVWTSKVRRGAVQILLDRILTIYSCVGQKLVMQDIKTVLVITLREFDIRTAYDERDATHPSAGIKTTWGERAYQVFVGAAHPADGFPCRVSKRA